MGAYRREKWPTQSIFSLCLFCTLLVLLSSCSQVAEENSIDAQEEIPDAQFADIIRKEYREGKLSMQFSAKSASWYKTDQRLEVEELSFITYNGDDGSVSASGDAEKAVFYEVSGDAEFSGYVHLQSSEGDASFESTKLSYKRSLDVFETPHDTEVLIKVGNQLLLAGNGLLFDVKQQYYHIQENVHGSVNQQDEVE